MNRSRIISLRLSEAEMAKIEAAGNGKCVGEKVRELALMNAKAVEGNIQSTASLLAKLENADITRVAASIARIEEKLDERNPANADHRLIDALIEIRDGIEVIQKARSDESSLAEFRKLAGWIKKTVEELRVNGKGGDTEKIEAAVEKLTRAFVIVGMKTPSLIEPMRKVGLIA